MPAAKLTTSRKLPIIDLHKLPTENVSIIVTIKYSGFYGGLLCKQSRVMPRV